MQLDGIRQIIRIAADPPRDIEFPGGSREEW
jgi:hypothetical protein